MVEFKQRVPELKFRQTHPAPAACTFNGYDILLKPFSQEAGKASYSRATDPLMPKMKNIDDRHLRFCFFGH